MMSVLFATFYKNIKQSIFFILGLFFMLFPLVGHREMCERLNEKSGTFIIAIKLRAN